LAGATGGHHRGAGLDDRQPAVLAEYERTADTVVADQKGKDHRALQEVDPDLLALALERFDDRLAVMVDLAVAGPRGEVALGDQRLSGFRVLDELDVPAIHVFAGAD